jgi:general secretion pathway protein L
MATLIVTLPQAPLLAGTPVEYVLTVDGRSVGQASSVPLGLLPGLSGTASKHLFETVVLVGAAYLSWHLVTLPKGVSGTRVRAVLEGLLEDKLLDDPAALHFALAPGGTQGEATWVAVCDKAWLRAGLQALDAAGLSVSRIVPELVPRGAERSAVEKVPLPEGALLAFENAGQPLLVHASVSGVLALPLQAATVSWLDWPAHAPLQAEPAVAALAERLFERPVQLQSRAERALVAYQNGWDLAQLDMVNTQRSRSLKQWGAAWRALRQEPRWRPVRWSLVALIAVNLIGLNVRAGSERASLQAQRQALATVLTSAFPATQVVVDAPAQMQRAVAALRQGSGELGAHDFETLLGAWARAAPAASAPKGLEYAKGQLRLQGLALAPPALAEATLSLKAQGIALRPEGADLLLRSTP